MRVRMGFAGVFGLGVAVTVGASQLPSVSAAPERSAVLLPPQPLTAADTPVVARASAEPLPMFLESTPVTRRGPAVAGPGWLNGTDNPVKPAAGVVDHRQPLMTSTLATTNSGLAQPSTPRPLDRIKGVLTLDTTPAPAGFPSSTAAGTPTPNSPFRGTTATGAPVYAGPPAYRWYGWGSVTPGANPHAPAGQYPKASANWHAITGATPGAFPVPVTNPTRPVVGTQPPVYVVNPPPRTSPPVHATQNTTPAATAVAAPTIPPPPDTPRFSTPTEPRIAPPPTVPSVPVAIPPSLPSATNVPMPATPVTVPTLTPVPPTSTPTARTQPVQPVDLQPLPVAPTVPVTEPPTPVVRDSASGGAVPAPLPSSVTDDQPLWQPARQTSSGEWMPPRSNLPAQNPSAPQSNSQGTRGQSLARGQIGDIRPDPVVTLIQRLCQGRADRVEVRWTGSNKLSVSFGCATAKVAQQLVKDISDRPELAPLQIDFAVVVK